MPTWKKLHNLSIRPKKSAAVASNESPFLGLPPEIRNCIYEYSLISPWPILVGDNLTSMKNHRNVAPPALCRTNRQIRRETLPIYYSMNTFEIHCRFNDRAEKGKYSDMAFTKVIHWLHYVLRDEDTRRQLGSLIVCTKHSFAFVKKCCALAVSEERFSRYAAVARKLRLEDDDDGEGDATCAAKQLHSVSGKHYRLYVLERQQHGPIHVRDNKPGVAGLQAKLMSLPEHMTPTA